ncbi:hypothetical protein [Agarilytica rhodophyticola]|uniref:hypothetical protein n=1 Tax=Agarilytica rhodophyticola TaxID=1737490 RepID=UPI000B347778|nr:hypothetical protein [Agarilytica rhodophyticola]
MFPRVSNNQNTYQYSAPSQRTEDNYAPLHSRISHSSVAQPAVLTSSVQGVYQPHQQNSLPQQYNQYFSPEPTPAVHYSARPGWQPSHHNLSPIERLSPHQGYQPALTRPGLPPQPSSQWQYSAHQTYQTALTPPTAAALPAQSQFPTYQAQQAAAPWPAITPPPPPQPQFAAQHSYHTTFPQPSAPPAELFPEYQVATKPPTTMPSYGHQHHGNYNHLQPYSAGKINPQILAPAESSLISDVQSHLEKDPTGNNAATMQALQNWREQSVIARQLGIMFGQLQAQTGIIGGGISVPQNHQANFVLFTLSLHLLTLDKVNMLVEDDREMNRPLSSKEQTTDIIRGGKCVTGMDEARMYEEFLNKALQAVGQGHPKSKVSMQRSGSLNNDFSIASSGLTQGRNLLVVAQNGQDKNKTGELLKLVNNFTHHAQDSFVINYHAGKDSSHRKGGHAKKMIKADSRIQGFNHLKDLRHEANHIKQKKGIPDSDANFYAACAMLGTPGLDHLNDDASHATPMGEYSLQLIKKYGLGIAKQGVKIGLAV